MTFSHAQIVITFFMNSCAVGHFEFLARETEFDQIALWDCFGGAITSVIGCYRFVWVKIRCPLQSHNAVRHNLNPVSRQRPQNCGQCAIHFLFSCPFAQLTFRFIPSSGEILWRHRYHGWCRLPTLHLLWFGILRRETDNWSALWLRESEHFVCVSGGWACRGNWYLLSNLGDVVPSHGYLHCDLWALWRCFHHCPKCSSIE